MGARSATRGRNRAPRRRSNAPKTAIGRMLQDYFQKARIINFASLGSGGDLALKLVDNDVDYTNSVLKWSKLTIRPIYDAEDISDSTFAHRILYMLIYKQDQDDSTVHALDVEETIRELRNTGRILRGPWMVTTPRLDTSGYVPPMSGHMKPIVLKNFVLDREEDLLVGFTNASAAFGAGQQDLEFYMRGFVRVIK